MSIPNFSLSILSSLCPKANLKNQPDKVYRLFFLQWFKIWLWNILLAVTKAVFLGCFVLMEHFLIVEFSVDFLKELKYLTTTEGNTDYHVVQSPQSLYSNWCCVVQSTSPGWTSAHVLIWTVPDLPALLRTQCSHWILIFLPTGAPCYIGLLLLIPNQLYPSDGWLIPIVSFYFQL